MSMLQDIKPILKKVVNIEFVHTDFAKRNYTFHISYRDENNKRIIVQDTEFYPYFYLPVGTDTSSIMEFIRDVEDNYTSLFGEKVKKITLNKVTKQEFMFIISNFAKTYEDDVMFLHRYIIDNKVVYNKNQRILYFDIETNFSLDIINADKEIISIACYDNFSNKYYLFGYHKNLKEDVIKLSSHSVYKFNDEKKMLMKFCNFLQDFKFDIITGWNVHRFDLPYVISRMRRLNLNINNLSIFKKAFCIIKPEDTAKKFKNKDDDNIYTKIYGITEIDLLPFYKKITGDNKPSNYRLGTVAKHLLGEEYDKIKINIIEAWNNNFDLLLEYNKKDVELCVRIDKKARLIEQLLYIQEMVPIPLNKTVHESAVIDQYILTKFHNVYVFNSKRKNEKVPFRGPRIIPPKVGLYKNVVIFDFKSMYPSIYITFNISPETVTNEGDVKINNLQFTQQKQGILPQILEEWLVYRYKLKKEMKLAKNDLEKSILDNRQGAVKMLLNSVYGAMGYKNFRLYNIDIPSTITSVARDLLTLVEKYFTELNYLVVYGHTDSVAVKLPDDYTTEDIDTFIIEHEKKINAMILDTFVNKYGRVKKCIIEIEGDRDKIFDVMLLDEGEARYVAYQSNNDKLIIKGFEFKKRDTPLFFKDVTYTMIKMLIKQQGFSTIKKYVDDKYKEMMAKDVYSLGSDKPINDFLESYTTNIQHIRAAKFSNQYLNTKFTRNQGGRLVFVKVLKKYPDIDCVLLEETTPLPPEMMIDYERLFDFHTLDKLMLLKNVKVLKINSLVKQLKQRHNTSLLQFCEIPPCNN